MVSLTFVIYALTITLITKSTSSEQFYDNTDCNSEPQVLGTNYICNNSREPCETFIVYRSQSNYQTISSISSLFNLNQTQILNLNNLTEHTSPNLFIGQEVLLPINCTCSGLYSRAFFIYNSSNFDTYSSIACGIFEGLSKMKTLLQQNPYPGGKIAAGSKINVSVRCACPDQFERRNGVKYLVTYPIMEGDEKKLIALKFNVSEEILWAANGLEPDSTIFPQTTLLIPTKTIPVINFTASPPNTNQSPIPTTVIPLRKVTDTSSKGSNFYILLGAGIVTAMLLLVVIALALILRIRKRQRNLQPSSARSSQLSSYSPDFYDRMSKLKHPLFNYSLEDLKVMTRDFSEDSKIGNSVYRGRINGSDFAIKQMSSGEAHQIIDILTTINHLNIVTLQGCCYIARPYLVFEFAKNGCLRDCLSDWIIGTELTWAKRVQIAFDVAVGLHYIHDCTSPSYLHRNINSKNVLITADWRAKIAGFGLAKALPDTDNDEKDAKASSINRLDSQKVDIFAFGIVLLELISAKEIAEGGSALTDFVGYLVEGGIEGSGCVKKLRDFMDPRLEGCYSLGDALCLALLAKGCVEEDPLHRPNMNDVLKALSRIT